MGSGQRTVKLHCRRRRLHIHAAAGMGVKDTGRHLGAEGREERFRRDVARKKEGVTARRTWPLVRC